MTRVDYIAQPDSRTTLDAIEGILQGAGFETMDVAPAYFTSGAVNDLLPGSSVRGHDAYFCLAHDGMPRVPFHPKAFLFRNNQHDYVLTGSGNVSRSGLSKGVEAGLVVSASRVNPVEPTSSASMQALRT